MLGVIAENQKLLLLQRKENADILPGIWKLPSGKRESNETSIEALIREVEEETGLSIVVECPISVFEYVIETPTEIRDTTQINFLVYPTNHQQIIKINKEEHQAARWFSKDELLSSETLVKRRENAPLWRWKFKFKHSHLIVKLVGAFFFLDFINYLFYSFNSFLFNILKISILIFQN